VRSIKRIIGFALGASIVAATFIVGVPASAEQSNQIEWNPGTDYEFPDHPLPAHAVDPEASATSLDVAAEPEASPPADSPAGIQLAEARAELELEAATVSESVNPTPIQQPSELTTPAERMAARTVDADGSVDPGPWCMSPGGQYGISIWGDTPVVINEVSANSTGRYRHHVTNAGTADWGAGSYLTYKLADANGNDIPGSYPQSPLYNDSLQHETWHDQTLVIAPLPPGVYRFSWTAFVPGVGLIRDLGACDSNTIHEVVNQNPRINYLTPAINGTVSNTRPHLVASAVNPDSWPSGPMNYVFTLCADVNMTVGCMTSASTTGLWQTPSALNWGGNYWWKVVVSDGAGSTDSTFDHGLNSFTIIAPGSDPWRQIGNGLGIATTHGVVLPYGVFLQTARDASVEGANAGLAIERTYSSGAATEEGAFGRGWLSVFDAVAVTTGTPSLVTITYPDGRQESFGRNADGTFASRADLGVSNRLTMSANGSMTVTESSGQSTEFDASGRLTRVKFPDAAWEITRTGGEISRITQTPSGRSIDVGWATASNDCSNAPLSNRRHVASLSIDLEGSEDAVWSYDYDCSRLTSVTDPEGGVTRYSTTDTTFAGTSAAGRPLPGLATIGNWQNVGGTVPHQERRIVVTDPGTVDRTIVLYKKNLSFETQYLDKYNDLNGLVARYCEVRTIVNGAENCNANPTTLRFDELNRLRSKTHQEAGTQLVQHLSRIWNYDSLNGALSSFFDENFHGASYTYDAEGNQTGAFTFRDANTQVTSYSFLNGGQTSTDPAVRVSGTSLSPTQASNSKTDMFTYDSVGRLLSRVGPPTPAAPAGETTSYTYTSPGAIAYDSSGAIRPGESPPSGLLQTSTQSGITSTFRYAENGDLTGFTQAGQGPVLRGYDDRGLVSFETVSGTGGGTARVVFTRDHLGRVLTETYPCVENEVTHSMHRRQVERSYDLDGQPLEVAERALDCNTGEDVADGRVTTFDYDSRGRVVSTTDSAGGVTRFEYSPANPDQLTAQIDPRDRRTEYTYSLKFSKVISVTTDSIGSAGGRVLSHSYQYDPAGRLTAESNELGRVTNFEYTWDDFVTRAWTPAVFSNGSTHDVELWKRTYDAAGRITSETSGNIYPKSGSAAQRATPLPQQPGMTRSTAYNYDAEGRLDSSVEDPGGIARTSTTIRDNFGRTVQESLSAYGRSESIRYVLDDSGQPALMTIENGAQDIATAVVRDSNGLVTRTTDPRAEPNAASVDAYSSDTEHDILGRPTKQIAPPLLVDTPASSADYTGLVQASVRPVTIFGYNAFGEITEVQNPQGQITRTTYDRGGRVTQTAIPDYSAPGDSSTRHPVIKYRYSTAGDLVEEQNEHGAVTLHTYNKAGNHISTTGPNVHGIPATTLYAYNAAGWKTRELTSRGSEHVFSYDALGRQFHHQTFYADPSCCSDGGLAPYVTRTFDDIGNVRSETNVHGGSLYYGHNPVGGTTHYTYNSLGELISILDPETSSNGRKTIERDVAGRVIRQTDSAGRALEYTYDLAGRLVGTDQVGLNGQRRTSTTDFDRAGNAVLSTDPAGGSIAYTYDADNRPVSQTRIMGPGNPDITVSAGYDILGNEIRRRDGNGQDTWTTYNTLGLRDAVIEPLAGDDTSLTSRTWTYSYDAAGNEIEERKPEVLIHREFNELNELMSESATGPGAVEEQRTFTYTNAGDIKTATSSLGTQHFTWGSAGQILTASGPQGESQFTYDDHGKLSGVQAGVVGGSYQSSASYSYDMAGRPKSQTSGGSNSTAHYDYTTGEIMNVVDETGSTNWTYDSFGSLATQARVDRSGTEIQRSTYSYNPDGTISSEVKTGAISDGTSYTYDAASRLISSTPISGEQALAPTTYSWDTSNNKTAETTGSSSKSFTYDSRNRLESIETTSDGSTSTVAITTSARGTIESIGTDRTLQFNGFDELTRDNAHQYEYDALGRLGTRDGAVFAYAGLQPKAIGAPSSDNHTEYVTRTLDGSVNYTKTPGTRENQLLSDLRGDVLGQINTQTGTLSSTQGYQPFGARISLAAGNETSPPASSFGFQGDWTDYETGAVNMSARWYEPSIGAFLSRDSIQTSFDSAAAVNRYGYGNANPISHIDPDGHSALPKPETYWNYEGKPASYPYGLDHRAPKDGIGFKPNVTDIAEYRALREQREIVEARTPRPTMAGIVGRFVVRLLGKSFTWAIPYVNAGSAVVTLIDAGATLYQLIFQPPTTLNPTPSPRPTPALPSLPARPSPPPLPPSSLALPSPITQFATTGQLSSTVHSYANGVNTTITTLYRDQYARTISWPTNGIRVSPWSLVGRLVDGVWTSWINVVDPLRSGPESVTGASESQGRSESTPSTDSAGACGLGGGTVASCQVPGLRGSECSGIGATARICLPAEPMPGAAGAAQVNASQQRQGGDAGPAADGNPSASAGPVASAGGSGLGSGGGGGEPPRSDDCGDNPPGAGRDWVKRLADNKRGWVWQDPNAVHKNGNMLRWGNPEPRYPNGYVRFYNEEGQPMDLNGKPGPPNETHHHKNPDGSYPTLKDCE
jgi:RHS repeat-associated protein